MKIIYNSIFLEHDTGMHPENKKRLESFGNLSEIDILDGEKYLSLVHSKEYIQKVKDACKNAPAHLDADTIISKDSYKAATMAVGATIMASESNGFALVRPPGHHAFPDKSSGFCIFNNIAIAVQKLANEGKKVMIFDFDGHLGDGTVKYFHESKNVLYWSLHQFPAFPGGGDVDDIGKGEGLGYTINIPLPSGTGDDVYMNAIDRFLPIAKQFNPDVVAVSAGFDAHKDDLLLELRLTENTYYKIGKLLSENFSNVFATLEGGYNINTLSRCLNAFLDGINNKDRKIEEPATDTSIQLYDECQFRLSAVEKNLSKYWKV